MNYKTTVLMGAASLFLLGSASQAALIGSNVTGAMLINSSPPNYFDPANGFVPANGYENSSSQFNSPTVPISATKSEFGYMDNANTYIADFGVSTFILTDGSTGGSLPVHFTFTDPQFAGLTIAKSNDTFPSGGVTFSLVGTTLTVDSPNTVGNTGIYNAQFTLTAVPEPMSLSALLLPAAALLRRRMR